MEDSADLGEFLRPQRLGVGWDEELDEISRGEGISLNSLPEVLARVARTRTQKAMVKGWREGGCGARP